MMAPQKVPVVQIVAAGVAFVFGVATMFAGGRVLLGSDPGYEVFGPLLIYNTIMGIAYVAAASPSGGRAVLFAAMAMSQLEKLRAVCLALPEAHEVEAWGAPTFRVKNKLFAMYAAPGNHHGAGRHGVWLHCAPENQRALVAMDPARYFVPPYVGKSGWVGVWIDKRPRWGGIEPLIRDAYRRVAPKRLAALVG